MWRTQPTTFVKPLDIFSSPAAFIIVSISLSIKVFSFLFHFVSEVREAECQAVPGEQQSSNKVNRLSIAIRHIIQDKGIQLQIECTQ
jgi:hypothetical protein